MKGQARASPYLASGLHLRSHKGREAGRMSLLLTAPQCFFLVILIFAVVGFQRGWKRELVSLGFSLGAVLFLYLGGGNGLAQFVFIRLPVIAQVVVSNSGKAPAPSSTTVPATDTLIVT